MAHNYDQDLMDLLTEPVDVRKLVDRLQFSLDNLEEAAMEQPKLYLRAGRLRVQAILRVSQLKRRLIAVSGERAIKIRQRREGLKEAEYKSRLALDPDVRHAQRKFDEAEAIDTWADDLCETYRQRLTVIVNLMKQAQSEINSELRSVKGQSAVETMDKRMRDLRNRLPEVSDD